MCGFSGQVVQILDHLGVAYKGLNVLESDDLRNGIKAYSNWPTIPQLYVKGEFVGGCDIIREMFQAGELQQTLKEKGVRQPSRPPEPPRIAQIKIPAVGQGFSNSRHEAPISANNTRPPDAAPSAPHRARR